MNTPFSSFHSPRKEWFPDHEFASTFTCNSIQRHQLYCWSNFHILLGVSKANGAGHREHSILRENGFNSRHLFHRLLFLLKCSRYAWANLFILPGTILFCFLGATAGSLADSGASGDSGIITIVTIVVGIVFGVLAIVVVSFYAKKELNKVSELIGLANDIYWVKYEYDVVGQLTLPFFVSVFTLQILEEQNEQDEDSSTRPEGGDEGDIEAGTAEEAKDGESPGNLVNQRSESQSTAAGSSSLSFVEEVS